MLFLVKTKKTILLAKKVKRARSFFERLIGLMGKAKLSPLETLWILPCYGGIHTFFMKFSIDVLFVNKKLQICYIKKNLKPWRVAYPPLFSGSHSVFEFSTPALNDLDVKMGDYLRVENQ